MDRQELLSMELALLSIEHKTSGKLEYAGVWVPAVSDDFFPNVKEAVPHIYKRLDSAKAIELECIEAGWTCILVTY